VLLRSLVYYQLVQYLSIKQLIVHAGKENWFPLEMDQSDVKSYCLD